MGGWLLLAGILFAVLVVPFLIIVFLLSSTSTRLPVDQEALLHSHEIITALQQSPSGSQPKALPDYLANCHNFLRERLQINRNQYTLTVTAAFDPNDPSFGPAGGSFNGSRDATVAVQFPDESEVELYFYGGTYENCRIPNP
jgi:hypothetical protein